VSLQQDRFKAGYQMTRTDKSPAQRLIDRIVVDERAVPNQEDDSFTYSYFAFLQYFRDLPTIDRQSVILINNSLVGVSKLLHFISPHQYAICDSNVARYPYLNMTFDWYHPSTTYRTYLQVCHELIIQPEFVPVHQFINKKVGQPVSLLRAVEMVMYYGGITPR
jgi:hypothetical protein